METSHDLRSLQTKPAILAIALLLLASCGGGPSNREVTAALMAAFPTTTLVDGVRTEDVTKLENGDYAVKISYSTKGGSGPLGDPPGHYAFRMTMTKIDGRWKIIRTELLGTEMLR
jgi:hypothetical protein